jgi:hemerythrin-like metal-binding protein
MVMVNSIEATFKAKDKQLLSQELEQVEYWLCAHFNNEERIAVAVGFDFARNKLEHQNLLKEFHRIRDELNAMHGAWSNKAAKQYYQYLCDWITKHVIEEDMLMRPVLETHEYNFCG